MRVVQVVWAGLFVLLANTAGAQADSSRANAAPVDSSLARPRARFDNFDGRASMKSAFV